MILLRLWKHHDHNHKRSEPLHLGDSACQGGLCFICCLTGLFYLGVIQNGLFRKTKYLSFNIVYQGVRLCYGLIVLHLYS